MMHLIVDLFVDAAGWTLILSVLFGLLLRWEDAVLVAKIEAVKNHVQDMPTAEAMAYLCKPDINRVFRMYEIRHQVPEDMRYSRRIVAKQAIDKAFSSVE